MPRFPIISVNTIAISRRKGGAKPSDDDDDDDKPSSSSSHPTSSKQSSSVQPSSTSAPLTTPNLTPSPSPSDPPASLDPNNRTVDSPTMKVGGIIGGVVAGLIILFLGSLFWWRSRRVYNKKKRQERRMDGVVIGEVPRMQYNQKNVVPNHTGTNSQTGATSVFSSDGSPSTAGFAGVGVYTNEKFPLATGPTTLQFIGTPSHSMSQGSEPGSPHTSPHSSPIILSPVLMQNVYGTPGFSGSGETGGIVEMHEVLSGTPISHQSRVGLQSQIDQLSAENERLRVHLSEHAHEDLPPAYDRF